MVFDNDEILVELECPVCTEYMHPPIRHCIMGHSFCSSCFRRVPVCPQCRQPKGLGRSFILEKLHAKLEFPCRNRDLGCEHRDFGKNIKKHEEHCILNLGPCPLRELNRCLWMGPKSTVMGHCRDYHNLNTFTASTQQLTWVDFSKVDPSNSRIFIVLEAYGEMFKGAWKADKEYVKWVVYLLGSQERARKYYFEIEASDLDDKYEMVSFRAPCRALEKGEEVDFEDSVCVMAHHKMLKKYCYRENLIYTVRVFKKDELKF